MVTAVLFPVCHPMGSTSDDAWYWQGGTLCNIFLCNMDLIKMCMSPGLQKARIFFFLHTFILSVDCAVKSLVTVEYRHAVISSNCC